MSVITEAVYNRLRNDPVLIGTFTNNVPNRDGLLSWIDRMGSYWDPVQSTWVHNSIPAIFTFDVDLAEMTFHHVNFKDVTGFIVTTGHVADSSDHSGRNKGQKTRSITKDVRCCYRQDHRISLPDSGYQKAEAIAERVYELFHRKTLAVPDPDDPVNYTKWEAVLVTCDGPVFDPGAQAKSVTNPIASMTVRINITIQESN